MNQIVNGTYTYLCHDLSRMQFKVSFQPSLKKAVPNVIPDLKQTATGNQRWVLCTAA